MKDALIDAVLWLLASPIYAVKLYFGLVRRWRFWKISYRPSIVCRSCGANVSLVGLWRCGCGYTYRGHVLRFCPVCGSLPRMVRCFQCGVTRKLPEP